MSTVRDGSTVSPTPSPQALATELPRLDAYHDVMVVANRYQDNVPYSMRAGLYQGGSLGDATQDAYLRELNTGLMPAVASMLRRTMSCCTFASVSPPPSRWQKGQW